MINTVQIYEQLEKVIDPELHIDIVSLGLIYDVKIDGRTIIVTMTLTTPGCPLAPVIDKLVRESILPLGKFNIELILVWDPPWSKDKMSEEARLKLGII